MTLQNNKDKNLHGSPNKKPSQEYLASLRYRFEELTDKTDEELIQMLEINSARDIETFTEGRLKSHIHDAFDVENGKEYLAKHHIVPGADNTMMCDGYLYGMNELADYVRFTNAGHSDTRVGFQLRALTHDHGYELSDIKFADKALDILGRVLPNTSLSVWVKKDAFHKYLQRHHPTLPQNTLERVFDLQSDPSLSRERLFFLR